MEDHAFDTGTDSVGFVAATGFFAGCSLRLYECEV
jgi:hypothetical protein